MPTNISNDTKIAIVKLCPILQLAALTAGNLQGIGRFWRHEYGADCRSTPNSRHA